jgi:hypothetical protein
MVWPGVLRPKKSSMVEIFFSADGNRILEMDAVPEQGLWADLGLGSGWFRVGADSLSNI